MKARALLLALACALALPAVAAGAAVAVGTLKLATAGFADAVKETDPKKLAKDLEGLSPAARQAAIYRKFLDNIEPSEWPYHAGDPRDWLGRTAVLIAGRE